MKIFKTKKDLSDFISNQKSQHKTVALVPTMGALHEGHLSLIEQAKSLADICVCSIFVNPTQFNDPKDLEKYPRPVEQDIEKLSSANCDVLFLPSVEEMYPQDDQPWHIDLQGLDDIWEGKSRPGHFQGVTQIVSKLFQLVQPTIALFGQKDFQQVMVIQHMVNVLNLPVKIYISPIIRNPDGLALSSRNVRLSEEGKKTAIALFQSLEIAKAAFHKESPEVIKEKCIAYLNSQKGIEVEYFAICETTTLKEVTSFDTDKQYVALVVAWVEGVRLIDNMLLN